MFSFSTLAFVSAQTPDTSVTVENTAPDFTVDPLETPASTGTSPTDVDSNVTWLATADDVNEDDYFLIVCDTDSVVAGGGTGNAPACSSTTFCVSSATTDETQATCSYTAQSGDAESNDWFAFVCDDVAGTSCSTSSQGSLSDGSESPFKVNHRPSFTVFADGGDQDPGGDFTMNATASDPDTDTAADTVALVVCDSNGGATYTGGTGSCTGNKLCDTSLIASNPNCMFNTDDLTAGAGGIIQDGNYTVYGYVFDSHDLDSGANPTSDTVTVNNVTPVVSSVTLNSGSDITLSDNSTVNVVVTATVTDNNSCEDLATVSGNVYRSGIGLSTCDENAEDNDNFCYAEVTCTISGNTCDNATDSSASYSCTIPVQFHADATDGSSTVTDSEYPTENWLSSVYAEDDGANSDITEVAAGVEMLSLIAISIDPAAIDYGSLAAGANTGATNQEIAVFSTGNVGIDVDLRGTDMTFSTFTIPVGNQEYNDSAFTFTAGSDLTASDVELELNVLKTLLSSSIGTESVFWGIEIPGTAGSGVYTGTNFITALKSEVADW